MTDEAIPKMTRLSQSIERVRYNLSHSAVRRAMEDYMDSKHGIILPDNWTTEDQGDGGTFIVADYITE